MLSQARMIVDRREDRSCGPLGAALYQQMGPLRRACFLNIVKKATHDTTAANCLAAFRDLLIMRQDRLFARVAAGPARSAAPAPMFKSAPGALHEPPPGFSPPLESFKSRDPHANLQVTFMTELATGGLAADIDIDEASGIEHGFEVIRNAVFNNRTNPYPDSRVHERGGPRAIRCAPTTGSRSETPRPAQRQACTRKRHAPQGWISCTLCGGTGPSRRASHGVRHRRKPWVERIVTCIVVASPFRPRSSPEASRKHRRPGPTTDPGRPPQSARRVGQQRHDAAQASEAVGRARHHDGCRAAELQKKVQALMDGGDAFFGDELILAALEGKDKFKSADTQTGNYDQTWLSERVFDNRTSLIIDRPTAVFRRRLRVQRSAHARWRRHPPGARSGRQCRGSVARHPVHQLWHAEHPGGLSELLRGDAGP